LAGLIVAPVETPRLVLRCVEPGDAEAFFRLITPAISSRLAAWPAPFTAELAERKISACLAAARDGDILPFVITRRDDGAVLGWVSVSRKSAGSRRGVVGYWLGADFHRQGILREAGTAAIAAGFERLGLTSLEASTHPDNAASAATLRSLGFRHFTDGPIWAETRQAHEDCHFFERARETQP
jgi:RimJ/RimL family protein N-acetyltransferase